MSISEAGLIQAPVPEVAQGERMRTPDEMAAMLALKARGWGLKRIARDFGTCPKTVRRYVREGAWSGYSRVQRIPTLAGLTEWLRERLIRHSGNADVVRQELAAEHGLVLSLRTVERACAPYRARTEGKDERGVGYVKRNAIAGRDFPNWAALEAHLAAWTRDVADLRVHGTTGEAPLERFRCDEAKALRPLDGTPPFRATRDLVRRVQSDCVVEVEGNSYSVPWRLIGERVRVTLGAGVLRISHGGHEVAMHALCAGRRERVVDPAHFEGVAGFRGRASRGPTADPGMAAPPPVADVPALLRPLAEYDAVAGGAW